MGSYQHLPLAITAAVVLLLSGCNATESTTDPTVACYANLNAIDRSKQIWMMEHHKTTNDIPTGDDLRPYFGDWPPKCPSGGTYTIGRIGEIPSCSVSEHAAAYQANR
jgi:uncharacterized protein YceK